MWKKKIMCAVMLMANVQPILAVGKRNNSRKQLISPGFVIDSRRRARSSYRPTSCPPRFGSKSPGELRNRGEFGHKELSVKVGGLNKGGSSGEGQKLDKERASVELDAEDVYEERASVELDAEDIYEEGGQFKENENCLSECGSPGEHQEDEEMVRLIREIDSLELNDEDTYEVRENENCLSECGSLGEGQKRDEEIVRLRGKVACIRRRNGETVYEDNGRLEEIERNANKRSEPCEDIPSHSTDLFAETIAFIKGNCETVYEDNGRFEVIARNANERFEEPCECFPLYRMP